MEKLECPRCHRLIEIVAIFWKDNGDGTRQLITHAHSMSKNSEIQCVCGKWI